MREQLRQWLTQARPSSLIIAGHSLGGAVASLFAYDLIQGGFPGVNIPSVAVVTYASPSVGGASWQSAFNSALPATIREAMPLAAQSASSASRAAARR